MTQTNSDFKNNVFIPTVAEFPDDIATSWELQKPLADAGYQPGFMLVIRSGDEGKPRVTDPDNIKRQYDNLSKFSQQYGNAPIITMLANIPIGDIDFLHNTDFAHDHVLAGIEFARHLPIGLERYLTFHLNSLVRPEKFKAKTICEWYDLFREKIQPKLDSIGISGAAQGVSIAIETVPVPEFGDPTGKDCTYHELLLRNLLNPFYITADNEARRFIEEAGLGICLDLCHNRTIYQAAADMNRDILFEKDLERIKLREPVSGQDHILGKLFYDMWSLNPKTDLVHLNDGDGKYTSNGGEFFEGIALGQGDIGLPGMIRYMNRTRIPFVLEINETDFKKRPNTRASIEYLLNHS